MTTKLKPDLNIIFEDENILVLDKPAGISTHPAAGEKEITLSELAAKYLKAVDSTGRDLVVHRLDKGTSGVIVFAKNNETAAELKCQFKNREVQKTYTALVSGQLESDNGKIDIPLARNERIRGRFDPVSGGKAAVTEFIVEHKYNDFTLVSAFPKTGRTHQIRTHFSAIGHPVAGDQRYGYHGISLPRIFLHAVQITLTHPDTKQKVTFESPLPSDLQKVLTNLS